MNTVTWQSLHPETDALGESPFWHPAEQCLYWVDVPGRRLRRMRPGDAAPQSWPMPSEPGCMAPARGGGLVVALRDGIYRALHWGGPLTRLAAALHDSATTRFNDGKADPLGRFWAGTIFEPRDAARAGLYCLDARPGAPAGLQHVVAAGSATTANGLAFAPDAGTLYWSDTPAHVIRAWDWDSGANALSAGRVLRQFPPKPPGWQPGDTRNGGYGGRPDGAAVDSQGNYWCALFEGGRLLQLSPAGELLRDIAVPVRCPTMPCFGGPDLRTLYLTSARKGRPDAELAAMPMSGQVLWTRVDVPGLPVNFFID
jgi:sugar lactone lactonase YvrE